MDMFKRLTRFTKRRRRLAKLLLAQKPIQETALIVSCFVLLGDLSLALTSKTSVVLKPCVRFWWSITEALWPPDLYTFEASYLVLTLVAALLSGLFVFGIILIIVYSLATLLHAFLVSIGSITIIHWSGLSIAAVTALLYYGILIVNSPRVIIEFIEEKFEWISNYPVAAIVVILFIYVCNLISAENSKNEPDMTFNIVKDVLGAFGPKHPVEIVVEPLAEQIKGLCEEDTPPQELIEFHRMPWILLTYGLSFASFGLSIFLDWMTPYRSFFEFEDVPWWEYAVNSLAYGFAFIGLIILGGCMIISVKFFRYLISSSGKKN